MIHRNLSQGVGCKLHILFAEKWRKTEAGGSAEGSRADRLVSQRGAMDTRARQDTVVISRISANSVGS